MTPRALGMLAGLLAMAAIVGWWWLRRGDDVDARASATGSAQQVAEPAATHAAPALPAHVDRAAASGDEPAVREYRSGNYEVRDHRTSGDTPEAPRDVPPNVHPPGARQLPSSLIHAITAPVRAAAIACGPSVPADARGAKPRVEGVVTVSIKNHQLAISDTAMQARDITGPAADAVRDCVAQKAVGAAVPASEQDDLDSYTINVAFAIP